MDDYTKTIEENYIGVVEHFILNLESAMSRHLPAIASCHRAVFPTSLSSLLGQRYLERMFSWYLSTSKTYLFHIELGGRCVGYCGAMLVDGSWPEGSTSSVLRYSFWPAIWAMAWRPPLWFHKGIWEKWPLFWKNIWFKPTNRKQWLDKMANSESIPAAPSVGLIVIGVHPDYQGKGFGSALLKEFERIAIEKYGVHRFHLSVRADNEPAIRAYEHAGWQRGELQGTSLSMWKEARG